MLCKSRCLGNITFFVRNKLSLALFIKVKLILEDFFLAMQLEKVGHLKQDLIALS